MEYNRYTTESLEGQAMDVLAIAIIALFNLAIGAPALVGSAKPAVTKKPAIVRQVEKPKQVSTVVTEEIVER